MPDPELTRRYLGGRGLNVRRLVDEVGPGADPLGPDNLLLVTPGLLTGTSAPTASRLHLSARSPLTGMLGSSSVGGEAGRALHGNAVAGLAIRGAAPRPVYLLVHDGDAELRPADELWGLDTKAAVAALTAAHGGAARADDAPPAPGAAARAGRPAVLAIGPAGERLARMACVVTERGHVAGRTGMGAVMGAKHLKAIVVAQSDGEPRGGVAGRSLETSQPTRPRPASDPVARAAVKAYLASIKAAPAFEEYTEYGTTLSITWANDVGVLPTRNFEATEFEGAVATDGASIRRFVDHTRGCRGCPVRCKAEVRLAAGRFEGFIGERPDFEPLVAWGAKVGIDDPEAVVWLHNRCDQAGLDSVSAGSAAAFAIHLFEEGVIDERDTGGLVLRWGDVEALGALLDQMAAVEGFGGLLTGGVRRAAAAIGRGADAYAFEVKGLELPAFDPRGAFGAALSFAVGSRGGDFTNDYARQEFGLTPAEALTWYGDELAASPTAVGGKAAVVATAMTASAALDSLGLCKIPAFTLMHDYQLEACAELAAAVSGTPLTAAALRQVGERVVALERVFNLRCGLTADDDTLPRRFLDEPLSSGPNEGVAVELAPMRTELYARLRWSADGVPTMTLLSELGLDIEGRDLVLEGQIPPTPNDPQERP